MQAVVPMHDESESEAERDESSITSGGWAQHAVRITPELLSRSGACETVSCVIMPEEVPARPLAVRTTVDVGYGHVLWLVQHSLCILGPVLRHAELQWLQSKRCSQYPTSRWFCGGQSSARCRQCFLCRKQQNAGSVL